MLREFRRSDSQELFPLLQRHFPAENRLIGFRPEAFEAIVRKIFQPHYRFLFALAELVRRPIANFFVIDVDGHLAATTLLTFPANAGYVSTVMVDDPYRRRGYAKQLLAAAATATRRAGRGWVVLDVLADNAPAKRLYEALGYKVIQEGSFQSADFPAPVAAGADPPPPDGIREIRRSDGEALTRLATAERPPEYARVLPASARQFFVSPIISLGLASATAGWVIDRGHGPEGFVRATTTDAAEAGNLTAPLIGPDVPPELATRLIVYATDWIRRRGRTRIATEVPAYNGRGQAALASVGFTPKIPTCTMALALDA
jgi:ribosomal protein S18 acetylase RimI-like enzyme